MLKCVTKYTPAYVNVTGQPTQVTSICGKWRERGGRIAPKIEN